MAAINKITKEIKDINTLLECKCSILNTHNYFKLHAANNPPEESIYKGGTFKLRFEFPNDYTFKPFKVFFGSNIFHPNINFNTDDSNYK